MAKEQVTEADLSAGVKSIGNLSAFTQQRPRRDSPFRDSAAEPLAVEPPPVARETVTPPAAPLTSAHEGTVVLKRQPNRPEAVDAEIPAAVSPLPRTPQPAEGQRLRKSDIHTERVTLPVSPEMRDRVDAMARELQRVRTRRGESITSNALIRAAIRVILERVHFQSGDTVNSEEELFNLLCKKVRGR